MRRNQFMSTPSWPARLYPWTYAPGLADACDPTVIRGKAIAAGAKVRIARELFPPMLPRMFVIVQDRLGNVQSIYRKGITK
jgi:hypothetical protein